MNAALIVVSQLRDWPFALPGTTVVHAREYLLDPGAEESSPVRVINLCRSYRYQTRGYYVSLLAEARGQHPLPDVKSIEDLSSPQRLALLGEALGEPALRSLDALDANAIELDIAFGRERSGRFEALAQELFDSVAVPLMRARFERRVDCTGPAASWRLVRLAALAPCELRADQRGFVAQAATAALCGRAEGKPVRGSARRPALAILHDPDNADPPSNRDALGKFADAATGLGMRCEVLSRHDLESLPRFDALFIRDTTNVNHYTYEFARRAAAEGLVVIDDPDSILKCTNKVFLHELLTRNRIRTPRTLTVHRSNVDRVVPTLGLPCILKRPDSAFSLGVEKVDDEAALSRLVEDYLGHSALIIAQEFLPTPFDWRVGVLGGIPLFVCRYYMAPGHWQVIKRVHRAPAVEGRSVSLPVSEAPQAVVDAAVRAAALIGNGLYGVDLKQVDDRCYVIEVNDNPNVDAGIEDGVLADALYRQIMAVFLRRIRERRSGSVGALQPAGEG